MLHGWDEATSWHRPLQSSLLSRVLRGHWTASASFFCGLLQISPKEAKLPLEPSENGISTKEGFHQDLRGTSKSILHWINVRVRGCGGSENYPQSGVDGDWSAFASIWISYFLFSFGNQKWSYQTWAKYIDLLLRYLLLHDFFQGSKVSQSWRSNLKSIQPRNAPQKSPLKFRPNLLSI